MREILQEELWVDWEKYIGEYFIREFKANKSIDMYSTIIVKIERNINEPTCKVMHVVRNRKIHKLVIGNHLSLKQPSNLERKTMTWKHITKEEFESIKVGMMI